MPSTFTWLDHSEAQRLKLIEAISLFKEKGTVDELGVGTIRDAFADLLFPGTGGPQTRARYFLFVPWMYLQLERLRVPSTDIARKARRQELELIERLLESTDGDGVIGRVARGNLQRLPSSIYWSGLRRLGIYQFDGSQEMYHQELDHFYKNVRNTLTTDDHEAIGQPRANWHTSLPPAPPDWSGAEASLQLTTDEGRYLQDRIAHRAPGTLFQHLVMQRQVAEAELPWQHPACSVAPAPVREQLTHAHNFSDLMHGSALLYNLLLAELRNNDAWAGEYRQSLELWASQLDARRSDLSAWDRDAFWRCVRSGGARVGPPTQAFVERWWDLALKAPGTAALADDPTARGLVRQREITMKGPLARVQNRRALDEWKGAAGTLRLSYRWPVAARICRDIIEAAERPDA